MEDCVVSFNLWRGDEDKEKKKRNQRSLTYFSLCLETGRYCCKRFMQKFPLQPLSAKLCQK